MKIALVRDRGRIGPIDYLLTAVGSVLAVYSGGMSIGSPAISTFAATFVVLGTLFSYSVRILAEKSLVVKADGVLYGFAIVAAVFFSTELGQFMPEGGFPRQLVTGGILTWMLIFGSFLSWRDGTLLFQAIPSIALFGLVGCYDTFRSATFAFFGFLICLCTLFARANARDMLRLAAGSGYFDRAGIRRDPTVAPEQSAELFEAVKRGPWRWVAGPEWALFSALAIVLISLLGAPVIQQSVQGVAGFVHIPTPPIRNSPLRTTNREGDTSTVKVGQGPLSPLSDTIVLVAQLDQTRYLRTHTYDRYTGTGWRLSDMLLRSQSVTSLVAATIDEIAKPKEFSFEVTPKEPLTTMPLPGEVASLSDERLALRNDGGYGSESTVEPGHSISGRGMEADGSTPPTMAPRPAPPILLPYLSTAGTVASVAALAGDATRGLTTDKARADAIMQAIASHAQYNIHAPAVAPGDDAVESFLFKTHQGYCDLFATSMVLMARQIGIPARYVIGYLPEPSLTSGGYEAREKDYHAWAELYFKGIGWLVYDPTSVATVVPGGGQFQIGRLSRNHPRGSDQDRSCARHLRNRRSRLSLLPKESKCS